MDIVLQQLANAAVLGSAYTLVTIGLYLVYTSLHIPNFAHGELFAVGAYLQFTFVTLLEIPFFPALGLSVVVAAAVGALLHLVVFRRLGRMSGFSILIGSLALAIVMQELISLVWGRDQVAVAAPFTEVWELGGVRISAYRVLILAIALTAAAIVAFVVYRTAYGRSLRAIAQNREIAELSGISVGRVALVTFALSAGLAGLAGALLAPTTTVDPHMGFHPTLVAFAILVVIGSGARLGAVVIGSMLVALAETFAAAYIANSARTAVVFLLLIMFLLVKPQGARRLATEMKVKL